MSPDMRNVMPLMVMLPHLSMSMTGRMDMAAVLTESTSPHVSPCHGSDSEAKLPPVAMRNVPTNARSTPTNSRLRGSRLPRRHTQASTKIRLSVCNTVAVPEFVQSMVIR